MRAQDLTAGDHIGATITLTAYGLRGCRAGTLEHIHTADDGRIRALTIGGHIHIVTPDDHISLHDTEVGGL